jgi:ADP-ribose pyrophosphatase
MSDDDLVWETLSSETGYACPGFDIAHETVRLPDGTETEFDYLSEGASVVVLPFTPEDEVVIVEEWRQAVGRVNRGLPAGGVEPEDPDRAAALRERGVNVLTADPTDEAEPGRYGLRRDQDTGE